MFPAARRCYHNSLWPEVGVGVQLVSCSSNACMPQSRLRHPSPQEQLNADNMGGFCSLRLSL